MCGRYALYGPISRNRPIKEEAERYNWLGELIGAINTRPPRFNMAPTQVSPCVVSSRDGIAVQELRWGLVPFWAKDIKLGSKAINARAETVAEKPMFRAAFKERRCLVPASGYFEWKGEAPNKQPYFIHAPDNALLLFAGLWEQWRPEKDAEPVLTFTIVTGPPGIVSRDIHDRAPLILSAAVGDTWLNGDVEAARQILSESMEPPLAFHPVSKAVGSPKNDKPSLVSPISSAQWEELRAAMVEKRLSDAECLLRESPTLVNEPGKLGETVLHFFAVENDEPAVRWLHEHGASLDSKNIFGIPTVFEVAQLGYRDLMKWFIENGVDLNAKGDRDGHSVFDHLEEFGHGEMSKYVRSLVEDRSP